MAYGLANILAAIPITPGGLGVVEFVLVSMIAGFGPTDGQALSAVLAYRAVNFWLPIPFGGLAYASLEFERRPSYRRSSGSSRAASTSTAVAGRRTAPTAAHPEPAAAGPELATTAHRQREAGVPPAVRGCGGARPTRPVGAVPAAARPVPSVRCTVGNRDGTAGGH